MRRHLCFVCTVLLSSACGTPAPQADSGKQLAAEVSCWPPGADSYDGGAGCTPSPDFSICEVPNGATVEADGGILLADGGPGSQSCTGVCSATEYALSCYSGSWLVSPPSPAPSLGCKIIPIPTPSSASFWCCACAQ